MIRESFYRVYKRKRIIVIALTILIINIIDIYTRSSAKVFTNKLIVQSAYLETMIANGNTGSASIIYTFLSFIIASLAMSDALVEDRESGINKTYMLKITKKEYLLKRFFINFFYGGFFVALVLIINLLLWLCIRPSFALTYYNTGLINEIFLVDLIVKSPVLFYLFTFLRIFLVAGIMASFSMLINDIFSSKYAGIGGVFVFDLTLTLIIDWINHRYGILTSFKSLLQLVEGFVLDVNIYTMIYPLIILIISFILLVLKNMKREII